MQADYEDDMCPPHVASTMWPSRESPVQERERERETETLDGLNDMQPAHGSRGFTKFYLERNTLGLLRVEAPRIQGSAKIPSSNLNSSECKQTTTKSVSTTRAPAYPSHAVLFRYRSC